MGNGAENYVPLITGNNLLSGLTIVEESTVADTDIDDPTIVGAGVGNDDKTKEDKTKDKDKEDTSGTAKKEDKEEEGGDGEEENEVAGEDDKGTKDKTNDTSDGDEEGVEVYQVIEEVFGEFVGEDGKKVSFDNTKEGFVKVLAAVADKVQEDVLDAIEKKYPLVSDLIDHLESGKSIDTFLLQKTPTVWEKVTLDKTDTEQLKHVIREAGKAKGISEARVEKIIKIAESEGEDELFKAAEEDYTFLAETEKKEREATIKEEEEALKLAQKDADEEWKLVEKRILVEGKIGFIDLPKAERDSFFKYVSVRDKKTGKTAAEIKRASLTSDDVLLIDLILKAKEEFPQRKDAIVAMLSGKQVEPTKKDTVKRTLKLGGPGTRDSRGTGSDEELGNITDFGKKLKIKNYQ